MKNLLKSVALASIMVASALAPAMAQDLSPAGKWSTTTGESRFQVSMCGDGTEVCALLTWLRDDAKTKANLALLNDYVVSNAEMTGENQWKGSFRFGGQSGVGKLTMTGENSMTLKGCKLSICKTFQFVRL